MFSPFTPVIGICIPPLIKFSGFSGSDYKCLRRFRSKGVTCAGNGAFGLFFIALSIFRDFLIPRAEAKSVVVSSFSGISVGSALFSDVTSFSIIGSGASVISSPDLAYGFFWQSRLSFLCGPSLSQPGDFPACPATHLRRLNYFKTG